MPQEDSTQSGVSRQLLREIQRQMAVIRPDSSHFGKAEMGSNYSISIESLDQQNDGYLRSLETLRNALVGMT